MMIMFYLQFNEVCIEILPDLEDIFRLNRPGLGVCLSKAAQKFPDSQNGFVTVRNVHNH